MAELNGREVQIVSHITAPDSDKVLIVGADHEEKSVEMKDLVLTPEEEKAYVDHKHKWLQQKLAPMDGKRKKNKKQKTVDPVHAPAMRVPSHDPVPMPLNSTEQRRNYAH